MTSADDPDPELWVRLGRMTPDRALRWVIAGSAHTYPGHFHVCSVEGDEHRSVNLGDVIETSPKAEIWLEGFLHGQEPGIYPYLGSDIDLLDAATEDDYDRWRAWAKAFRHRGHGPLLNDLPAPSPELSRLGWPTPWCFVGGLFRTWAGSGWVVAEPQPVTETPWFWPGSPCESLAEHEYDSDESFTISFCERCHDISAS